MNQPLEISQEFKAEITRRSQSAADWIDRLPDTFNETCQRWRLHIDGSPMYGKTSMVIPVIASGQEAVLKLVSPVVDMASEARALRLFAGTSIVEMLDASEVESAILLERLEDTSLMQVETPEYAVAIAGEIASSIGAVNAPAGVQSLAADASGWLIGIQQQHQQACESGTNVGDEQFSAVLEIIDSMRSFDTKTMTHGDLSMENILKSDSKGRVAIDPLLVCGPITNEAHTVIRSFLPQILDSDTPGTFLDNLTRRFCEAAAADFEQARRISFARYVASYYWESQNGGNLANVRRLRQACDLTYQELT